MEANYIFTSTTDHQIHKEKRTNINTIMTGVTGEDFDDLMGSDGADYGGRRRTSIGGAAASKRGSAGGSAMKNCQAERCSVDLNEAKAYHRRHKVCEHHAKAQAVVVAGIPQRFCQQCSRFHELSEFDEAKRSCRRRLAGHNERRRKNFADNNSCSRVAESSSMGYGQVDNSFT